MDRKNFIENKCSMGVMDGDLDESYMALALGEAKKADAAGEVQIGRAHV